MQAEGDPVEIDAVDIDPTIAEDGAVLIVTSRDGSRVGVRMTRAGFRDLVERMRMALDKSGRPQELP